MEGAPRTFWHLQLWLSRLRTAAEELGQPTREVEAKEPSMGAVSPSTSTLGLYHHLYPQGAAWMRHGGVSSGVDRARRLLRFPHPPQMSHTVLPNPQSQMSQAPGWSAHQGVTKAKTLGLSRGQGLFPFCMCG